MSEKKDKETIGKTSKVKTTKSSPKPASRKTESSAVTRKSRSAVPTAASTDVVNKKKKKKKISKRRVFLTVFIVLIVAIIVAVSVFGIIMINVVDDEFLNTLDGMSLKMNSVVYAKNPQTGAYEPYEMIISEEDRTWVSIDKIPLHMQRAMVAIEDERFYSHSGVDIKRTTLAVIGELTGGSDFGGSTITQQLVKNITGDKEHSRGRKVREIARAIAVEKRLSKDQILEMYMNTIYLGQNSYGVASAARTYFNKSVSDLTLAEAASIVGITKYPSLYDPVVNPEKNRERKNTVLDKMCELGYITAQERDSAKAEELVFLGKNSERSYKNVTSYFTDLLYEQVIDDLIAEKGYTQAYATYMVENGGLKIYATIDRNIQAIMDKEFNDKVNFANNMSEDSLQAAMVITDPYTGEIKGVVGGKGEKKAPRVLNRAVHTKRQPGSSFKPLSVYAPAIDTGIATPCTTVDNEPIKIGTWTPKNDNNKFSAPITLRTAITYSRNIPAINILSAVSIDKSYEYLTERFHITSLVEDDKNHACLALGGLTDGVSVLEMAAAYSSLPNGGIYNSPKTYTKVLNNKGEVIMEKGISESRAISEDAAYIMCDIMKDVVSSGTAAGNQIPGMDTAGKTGTTDNSKDRWFSGFTPYYCGTVWYGYDVPKVISSGYTNPALNIWKKVMTEIHKDLEPRTFTKPAAIKKVNICTNSGRIAAGGCPTAYEYVTREHGPTSVCSSHDGRNHIKGKYNTGEGWEDEEDEDEESDPDNEDGDDTDNGDDTPPSQDAPDREPPKVPSIPIIPDAPPVIG